MWQFFYKGLARDHTRSLFPLIIISLGVAITVLFHSWLGGVLDEMIELNARFSAGHLKVTTRAYAEKNETQATELSLQPLQPVIAQLNYPEYRWFPRIKFGGLLDIPDENGETRDQRPVFGIAAQVISSPEEVSNLRLDKSLVQGRLIKAANEALISELFFQRLQLKLGDEVTFIGSTMHSGMAMHNFKIVGTVQFGIKLLDYNFFVTDIGDMQLALDMEDGTSELLGFAQQFEVQKATAIKQEYNQHHKGPYEPYMATVRDHQELGQYIDLSKGMSFVMIGFFMFIITIILWNSSLRSGIRRYQEFGLRLALGESSGQIYRSQLGEAFLLGIAGSILGTLLGLMPAYYLQEFGLNIKEAMESAKTNLLMDDIIRAKITSTTLWIGFIPGIIATISGSAIAGIAIFRRQSSQLLKELEL